MSACRSAFNFSLNQRFCHFNRRSITRFEALCFRRNYLSSAYQCKEEWNNRLKSSLLSNLKIDDMFVELDKRFSLKKKISCVDVDLFACGVQSNEHLEELENVLHRFRRTRSTANMLESTNGAVIRIFLQHNRTEDLLRILQDRINYGIFPDQFGYNMLMDHFLVQKNYKDAAKVAVLMMLQEEQSNPIGKILSLYSCHMYLQEMKNVPWYPEENKEEVKKPEGEEEVEEEEEEDVYVRVPYLRNPSFDDHFDLVKPEHLIGKTLYSVGKGMNDAIGRSCQLVGLGLYQKWDKVGQLLDQFIKSAETNLVLAESISAFEQLISPEEGDDETITLAKTEIGKKVDQLKSETSKIETNSLQSKLESKLTDSISQFESTDIQTQIKKFQEWEVKRSEALEAELEEVNRKERLEYIATKKKELHEKEQLLFFFENWNKHEMELAEIEAEEKSRPQVSVQSEEYVPPEITKKEMNY